MGKTGITPAQRSFRLKTVVGFARYLSAEDSRHEVPPDDFFGGYQIRRRTPFIFTIADVNRLVETASRLGPPGFLRRHTYSTLFALLSVTGMRVSEALSLRFEDLTADGLWIRKTKFGKSRIVPLNPTAVAGLEKIPRPAATRGWGRRSRVHFHPRAATVLFRRSVPISKIGPHSGIPHSVRPTAALYP
jgi:integrase